MTATGEGGVALGKFDGAAKGLTSAEIGVWQSLTKPAFALGANFDYNFYPNLAFRVSPTYLASSSDGPPTDTTHGPPGTIRTTLASTPVLCIASARSSSQIQKTESGLDANIEPAPYLWVCLFQCVKNARHELEAVALETNRRLIEIVIQ